jgi:hypothetical protein
MIFDTSKTLVKNHNFGTFFWPIFASENNKKLIFTQNK